MTAGPEQMCRRCGAPIGPYLNPDLPCSNCRRNRFAFDRVICLGKYDGRLRSAPDPIPTEMISIPDSLGRIIGEPIKAKISSPHYHAAAMDGVAVVAEQHSERATLAGSHRLIGHDGHPVHSRGMIMRG